MEKKASRIRRWIDSLKENYHLTLVNKDSFEQLYSLNVSKGKFLLWVLGVMSVIFLLAFSVISFTPIKKIVPGFESDEMHHSLLDILQRQQILEEISAGKLAYATHTDSILKEIGFEWGKDDTLLQQKAKLKQTKKTGATEKLPTAQDLSNYHFYPPVKGLISQEFKLKDKHYGIDIVCKKNETVKATLPGIIIVALWSVEEGHILGIQHSDNLISFYKHNSVLLKRKGDLVKAGEVIAIVGNSGELSSGPHLHFELWENGNPIDPKDIISFE